MDYKVLIIEDDKEISNMVSMYLKNEGYNVVQAFNGREGIDKALDVEPEIILLDLMLPIIDGMECLKKIRETSIVPILIMSAKNSDLDKALGLGLGADDYIEKPFSIIELSARIKAILRRNNDYIKGKNNNDDNKKTIGNLEIDFNSMRVIKGGEDIALTSKEFEILKLFITRPNRVFTKAQIYELVWNDEYYGEENVINVHMRRLREKIEDNPSKPSIIKTLWGIGYKYEEQS
ncbi:MAG: response regulator transcription factor [Clostridium sp.]|uniref:response regulator transcription factor n=1 Tax=Clostridium sp. TaxID=1506 RepID=UPI003F3756CB